MPRIERTANNQRRGQQQIQDNLIVSQSDDTIDLIALFYRLLEDLKYIIVVAVLGAAFMMLWTTYYIDPLYKATSKIYVLSSDESAINLADLQLGTALTADYQEVFRNWIVHERVIEALDLPYSYGGLAGMLSVTNPANTRILYITVTSKSAQEAKMIADTYAKVASEFIASTFDTKQPNIFEEALLPTAPFSPSKTKNTTMGFFVGLFLSIGISTIRFITGDKIRSSEDIEAYAGLPTLGAIPMQSHFIDRRTKTKAENKQKKKAKKGVGKA